MNRHHLFKPFLTALLTIAALAAGQSTWAASTWSVTSTTSAGITTFTITRSTNATAETVYYRTVSLSALEGQHFTAVSGSLTFTAGQTSKTVTVTEATPSDAVYKVYSSTTRQYRFDLLDVDGTIITQCDRNVSGGTQFTDTYLNNSITGLAYFDKYGDGSLLSGCSHYLDVAHSGSAGTWVKVGDGGYSQAVHTISTGTLYNNNSTLRTYLNSSGTKMYATVYFTQKEDQDGYQYIQILADNSSTYDGNDPNGAVTPPQPRSTRPALSSVTTPAAVWRQIHIRSSSLIAGTMRTGTRNTAATAGTGKSSTTTTRTSMSRSSRAPRPPSVPRTPARWFSLPR